MKGIKYVAPALLSAGAVIDCVAPVWPLRQLWFGWFGWFDFGQSAGSSAVSCEQSDRPASRELQAATVGSHESGRRKL